MSPLSNSPRTKNGDAAASTAQSYSSAPVSTVPTHFVRVEHAGPDSGRLDSDLARLAESAGRLRPRARTLLYAVLGGNNDAEGSGGPRQVTSPRLDVEVTVILVGPFCSPTAGASGSRPQRVLHLPAEWLEVVAACSDLALVPPRPASWAPLCCPGPYRRRPLRRGDVWPPSPGLRLPPA